MPLKDFRPEIEDINEDEVPKKEKTIKSQSQNINIDKNKTEYQNDIHTMNIKKLSGRLTIVTILLLCIMGATVFFVYFNIKTATMDEQAERDKTIQAFKEQAATFDIRLEKIQFDIENNLSALNKKADTLQSQMAQIMASKLDSTAINEKLKTIDTRISKNSEQTNLNLQNIEKNKTDTVNNIESLKKNIADFKQDVAREIARIKSDINDIDKGIDGYKQQVLTLAKDLSINDKRLKTMEQTIVSKTEMDERFTRIKKDVNNVIIGLDKQVQAFGKKIDTQLYRFQKEIDLLKQSTRNTITKSGTTGSSGTNLQQQSVSPDNTKLEQKVLKE
jgi:chromosome segregation ATPase